MSTRSTYRVREKFFDNKEQKEYTRDLVLMYIQCDGYPSGHPSETAEWLSRANLVNGIGAGKDKTGKTFMANGTGCLAAQLVAKYKDGVGSCYLHAIKQRGNCGEDYTYDIVVDYKDQQEPQSLTYIAYECGWKKRPKKIWEGKPEDFQKFVEKWGQ